MMMLRALIVLCWTAVVLAFAAVVFSGEFQPAQLVEREHIFELLLLVALVATGATSLTDRLGRRRARAAFARLVLVTIGLALALTIAEVGLRVAFRRVHSAADVRSYFATHGLPIRINNVGFRGADVGPKQPGRYRIAVIGDSITWGQGIAEDERFSNVLQRSLGEPYEILNFGMPGHDLPHYLAVLSHPVLDIAPDFILLALYLNDFETREMNRPRPAALLPWPALDLYLLRRSAVYSIMTTQWGRFQAATGLIESYPHYMDRNLRDPTAPNAREAFGMLRDFIWRAHAAHVAVGTVFFPNPGFLGMNDPFDYIYDRVNQICREESIHCLDLRPVYATFRNPASTWVNRFDPHPNARMNHRAAAAILQEFGQLWR